MQDLDRQGWSCPGACPSSCHPIPIESQVQSKICALSWTADGSLLALGCFDGTVSIRCAGRDVGLSLHAQLILSPLLRYPCLLEQTLTPRCVFSVVACQGQVRCREAQDRDWGVTCMDTQLEPCGENNCLVALLDKTAKVGGRVHAELMGITTPSRSSPQPGPSA
jgi:hypothetical protein